MQSPAREGRPLRRAIAATIAAGSVLGSMVAAPQAAAQGTAAPWPSKPIRFIVPWTPGSGTDLWSRAFAARLQETIGQSVVIDNRGGAGTVIGTEIAAKAPADGYTIYVGGSVSLAISPAIYPKVGYDPVRDFAPVSLVSRFYNAIAVHPSLPVKSVKELIALSRRQPGALMMASAGNGSTSHLVGELFMAVGTPVERVGRLHAATVKAANSPEFREVLEQDGSQLVAGTPEQFATFIRSEYERHVKLIKAAGIRP